MITNFETITYELTPEELKLVMPLLCIMRDHNEENPIKAPELVGKMNLFIYNNEGFAKKFTERRLRKLANFIRSESISPLVATSEGYFITFKEDILKTQIKSLVERSNSIMTTAKGLEMFLDNMKGLKDKIDDDNWFNFHSGNLNNSEGLETNPWGSDNCYPKILENFSVDNCHPGLND